MKEVTKLMINEFKIKKLGYDFMGYSLQKGDIYTFHHLIIPRRNCKELGLGDGYLKWNGSILCGNSSHPYLHLIEYKDEELFYLISSEMIDQNMKGRLDIENLRRIRYLLEYFEKEHSSDRDKKGRLLIKEEYTKRFKF